jgi:hypothetical protein
MTLVMLHGRRARQFQSKLIAAVPINKIPRGVCINSAAIVEWKQSERCFFDARWQEAPIH